VASVPLNDDAFAVEPYATMSGSAGVCTPLDVLLGSSSCREHQSGGAARVIRQFWFLPGELKDLSFMDIVEELLVSRVGVKSLDADGAALFAGRQTTFDREGREITFVVIVEAYVRLLGLL